MVGKRCLAKIGFGVAAMLALALPGASSADDYPQGCVSCHVEKPGATDLRLNTLLRAIGHHYIRTVEEVPGDCYRCHQPYEDRDYLPFSPSLGDLLHAIHYQVPDGNTFVSQYGGDCQGCHVMDAEEGEARIKGGAKNW